MGAMSLSKLYLAYCISHLFFLSGSNVAIFAEFFIREKPLLDINNSGYPKMLVRMLLAPDFTGSLSSDMINDRPIFMSPILNSPTIDLT